MASVHPITLKQQDTLEQLANQWFDAKKTEEAANKLRLDIENRILQVHPARQEGSETIELDNGLKLVLTGKLSYKANVGMLIDLCENVAPELRPLKVTTTLDETAAKRLRSERPDVWAQLAPAITVAPAKTSITLKV